MRILDLGPLWLETAGVVRPLSGRRLESLLVAMLLRQGQIVTADYLIDVVWGDDAPVRAAAALDTLVWRLRRQLEPARPPGAPSTVLAHTDAQGYRLALEDAEVDSWAFTAFAQRLGSGAVPLPARLDGTAAALQLWRGLPYGGVPEGEWLEAVRTQLAEHRLTVRIGRIDALLALGQPERAVAEVVPMLAEDPYAEPLWARRILGLRQAGRSTAATAAYRECAEFFDAELGVSPGPEVQAAREAGPTVRLSADAGRRPVDGEFRVPAPRTALVGREPDIAAVADLVRAHRQAALVGPVGCGKTRLAIATAHELRESHPDGVYFADLSGVIDGSVTGDRIQQVLRLPDEPARHALRVVLEFLAGRAVLLILDNCEQIGDAVASLAETVLLECPHVSVLITSREPLGMEREVLYHVRPLQLPTGSEVPDLVASPAATLLADRLGDRTALTGFTDAERTAITRICAATDGLPLSLELAAALNPVLQLHEIADHLTAHPMGLHPIGRRSREPRGDTSLRDSIEWSHQLLTPDERTVHRRLAVLSPEFSLDAAIAVCADAEVRADRVLPALAGLAYRSLLDALGPGRDGGPSRFHQLAPMRAHAAEQLSLDGEAAIVAERRNGWARALLLSGPRPGRPGQAAFYQQIGDSHRTITDSMFAAAGTGPCDQDVFAVARLLPYWIDRMIPADPLRISTALARSVTDANGPLARAAAVLVRGAVLAANQQASVVHDELLRATADIRQVSFDQADAGCWTQIADLLIVTASCCWIGDDFELTATIAHLADDHANHLDDPDLRLCAAMFGCLTGLWEDPASAAATATELSAQSHAIGNDLTALMASVTCSIAALLEGDGVVGLHWTAAALRLQRTLGVRSIADTLETRGNHYVTAGQPVEAVRCYGAAHLQQYRQGRPWPHHPGTGRRLDAAREALSLKDFANAWAEGERIGAADLIEDWL